MKKDVARARKKHAKHSEDFTQINRDLEARSEMGLGNIQSAVRSRRYWQVAKMARGIEVMKIMILHRHTCVLLQRSECAEIMLSAAEGRLEIAQDSLRQYRELHEQCVEAGLSGQ